MRETLEYVKKQEEVIIQKLGTDSTNNPSILTESQVKFDLERSEKKGHSRKISSSSFGCKSMQDLKQNYKEYLSSVSGLN